MEIYSEKIDNKDSALLLDKSELRGDVMYFQYDNLLFICSPYYNESSSYRRSSMLILIVVTKLPCVVYVVYANTGHCYVLTYKQSRRYQTTSSRWTVTDNYHLNSKQQSKVAFVVN